MRADAGIGTHRDLHARRYRSPYGVGVHVGDHPRLCHDFGLQAATVRRELEALRQEKSIPEFDIVIARIQEALDRLRRSRIQRVINGTGIIVHTNLGRSPLGPAITKTLQEIAHGGPVEQNLMFAGHSAFRFKSDPFYSNGFIPTVKQLVDRILTGA